jgi:hypothetical protein
MFSKDKSKDDLLLIRYIAIIMEAFALSITALYKKNTKRLN